MRPGEFDLNPSWAAIVIAKQLGNKLTPELATQVIREIDAGPTTPHDLSQFQPEEYGDYTISAARMADILPELHELHQLHYLETEVHRAGLLMDPDYEAMLKRERAGDLLQCVARHRPTGKLVANMRVYLGMSYHTQTPICTEDTFYVMPEHRGGFMAVRLWKFTERAVIQLGVREIYFDSKTANRADSMARYLKYKQIGIRFCKVIEQPLRG